MAFYIKFSYSLEPEKISPVNTHATVELLPEIVTVKRAVSLHQLTLYEMLLSLA